MLQLIEVSKIFRNSGKEDLPALHDLNITIEKGEFVCVVGVSGCGKTTMLRLIAGLDFPTEGKILMDGKAIDGPGWERCVVFQRYTLFPWRTVSDNVAFPLEIQKVDKRERRMIKEKYIDLVGLGDFAGAYPSQLSGGMQQRVAVARALAANPKILLMDEPFGALDSRTREGLQNELVRIWQCEPKTVLFVTHSIGEAVTLADRVVVMSGRPGRVRSDIAIDLPRPRDKEAGPFREYYARIHRLLDET